MKWRVDDHQWKFIGLALGSAGVLTGLLMADGHSIDVVNEPVWKWTAIAMIAVWKLLGFWVFMDKMTALGDYIDKVRGIGR